MENRTCAVDGCMSPSKSRGWCSTHHARWSRHGHPLGCLLTCTICAAPFRGRSDRATCDRAECKREVDRGRKKRLGERRSTSTCAMEGCEKVACTDSPGYCDAHYARWRRYGDPHGIRRICTICGSAFYKNRGMQMVCDDPECRAEMRRRQGDKRRAAFSGGFVEHVVRRDIFERDGWRCHLCGLKVRQDKKYPHPLSPTLDHVIPLSVGGTHERTNLRCAHARCNTAKHNRAVNEQLLML